MTHQRWTQPWTWARLRGVVNRGRVHVVVGAARRIGYSQEEVEALALALSVAKWQLVVEQTRMTGVMPWWATTAQGCGACALWFNGVVVNPCYRCPLDVPDRRCVDNGVPWCLRIYDKSTTTMMSGYPRTLEHAIIVHNRCLAAYRAAWEKLEKR